MTDSLISSELRPRPAVDQGLADGQSSRTLLHAFAETAARYGQHVAIDAPDAALTYTELERSAQALAERLRSLGVGPGDRVGIYLPSGSAQLYEAILGVLHAGAAYVPVDADDPPARAAAIWESSGACAVIEDRGMILELRVPLGEPRQPIADDDAWVIFTSGSTGRPKGVAVTHQSAVAFVDAETALWTVTPQDRVLAGSSVGFDASCEEIWLAWRNGAALVPAPRALMRAGSDLGPWLARRGVTVVSTVPTLAAMLRDGDISDVRLLILGGEACHEALAWRLAEGRELWNTYGPTEATVVSTAARLRAGEPVTIGWPLRGWEIAIVDEFGEPVALGEPGELVIAGVGLGRYLDPALDAEHYGGLPALGWHRAYRTGDVVRETIAGLQFIGRRDDQVKLGGRRLELGEIDAELSAVPGVRAGAAAVQRTTAGNQLLVGYVVGDVESAHVRAALAERLPEGIVPLVVELDALPTNAAGKVDRKSLPWPPPPPRASRPGSSGTEQLGATEAWLAERWMDQLGPVALTAASDFFELGGTSLAVARLVSALRARYPAVAVSDVYAHRRLGELAARLDRLETATEHSSSPAARRRGRWSVVQLLGVLVLLAVASPQWLLGILALNRIEAGRLGPRIGWVWLIGGWLIFATAPGRTAIVVLARRLLLADLAPGRYPRRGWLACRVWFVERLAEGFRSDSLAGTPFAPRFARLCGHRVEAGTSLGSLPSATSLVSIEAGATLEAGVDAHGWCFEGEELVVGRVRIGSGARVGTRALLGPGAEVGDGAEVEPGSVITGRVPPGERWSGSPAARIGEAGERWPQRDAPRPRAPRVWRAMYAVGLAIQALLPFAAATPGLAFLLINGTGNTDGTIVTRMIIDAPLLAASLLVSYALLTALLVRICGPLVRPGWHPDDGATGWALWFTESLMAGARGVLFSLCASLFMRPWLRLLGVKVGPRAEVSTAVGLNRLTSLSDTSFVADDVMFAGTRARDGWLHVAPIAVGTGTFLGNGAILAGDTELGPHGLIGVLTSAPQKTAAGTSWLGAPALELPRVRDLGEPSRTTHPPRRLVVARGAVELIRIVLPITVSVMLAALLFGALDTIGSRAGIAVMTLAAPTALLAAGAAATAITIAAKWVIIGRYRPGAHPLWSFFVWRDEILNSLQAQLADAWLLGVVAGTPLMAVYLRAMGAKVGRDVWCESLALTEFDVVELGDGCVINRFACVETHLFHDRLMRIGPAKLGSGSTLGPSSCILPDAVLGAGARVGGRSVVLRGEELPRGTCWQGVPLVSL